MSLTPRLLLLARRACRRSLSTGDQIRPKVYLDLKESITAEKFASYSSIKNSLLYRKMYNLDIDESKVFSVTDCVRLAYAFNMDCTFSSIIVPIKRSKREGWLSRPPMVTVMGHVDHGKTTLLDSLRQSSVAQSEAGGITQHIGAFSVVLPSGAKLTFLDTPGHAAFVDMRARGAKVTDLVVLVVAADDGVKEQTVESIKMIKAANVPMVVAINKCDKHDKDIMRVKQELLKEQVQLEEYGGEVQGVEVSALKGEGLAELEEALLALAEVSKIKAKYDSQAEVVILETRVDKGLGPMATVLVVHGTLCPGTILVLGLNWFKVRVMQDNKGQKVTEAPPSTPVLVSGWKKLPTAGEIWCQAKSEQDAKISVRDYEIQQKCLAELQQQELNPPLKRPAKGKGKQPMGRFRTFKDRIRLAKKRGQSAKDRVQPAGEREESEGVVPLIVKGDVAGSVEALVAILESRQPKQKVLKVIHTGVGDVTDTDVDMAFATKGIILGFGVDYSKTVGQHIRSKKVKVISNQVIYKILDSLRGELEDGLPEEEEEEEVGQAEVLKVYRLRGDKAATIGGSVVRQGKVMRSGIFRVFRQGKVVHEGQLSGMKTEKQDVSVVSLNKEVGFKFVKDFTDFQEGDRVVCFKKTKLKQKLEWNLGF